MVKTQETKDPKPFCQIKIDYEDSIRCIDLENILTGLRMIAQHELVKDNRMPRKLTDVVQIGSIEKGSIVINMFFDVIQFNVDMIDVNINLMSFDVNLLNILILYFAQKIEVPQKLRVYFNGIKNAIQGSKGITIKNSEQEVKIAINKKGEVTITQKGKEITVKSK